MINGGFQNYLHMMYGLPNGFIQAKTQPDTSDLLLRGLRKQRKRKKEEELLEEQLALQILQARQQDIVLPDEIDKDRLSEVLQAKLSATPLAGEIAGKERQKRIHLMILALMMED